MTFTLFSETSSEKIYKIESADMLIGKKVEADANFASIVGGAKYLLQGDMDSVNIMWLTIFK